MGISGREKDRIDSMVQLVINLHRCNLQLHLLLVLPLQQLDTHPFCTRKHNLLYAIHFPDQ
jgi:hypothetical protein